MSEHVDKRNELLAARVIKGLGSRQMEGFYAKTRQEALELALKMIPENSAVGWGGSMSVQQIGLLEAVRGGAYRVIDRDKAHSPEEKRRAELACFDADWFLCGCNAITEDGVLVNIDGHGNRTSAIIFGPRNVLMIVGMNKVAPDVDMAVKRARSMAATCNAQRFPIATPCRLTGSCADCKAAQTICCQFLLTRFSMDKGRIKVILVGEELGF